MAKKIITAVTGLALAAGITVTSTTSAAAADYTVKEGDCLWKISKEQLGKGTRYKEIFEVNKDTIKDPRLIRVGQTLRIPGKNDVADSGIEGTSVAPGTGSINSAEITEASSDASIDKTTENTDAPAVITPYSSFAGKWVGMGYYVDGVPSYEAGLPDMQGGLQSLPSKLKIEEDGSFSISQLIDIAGHLTETAEGFVHTSPQGLYNLNFKYDSGSDTIRLSGTIRGKNTDVIYMREPEIPGIASKVIGKWVCVEGSNLLEDSLKAQDYHIEFHNLKKVQIEFLPDFKAKVTYNPDIVFETNYMVEGNYIRIPFVKDQNIRLYIAVNPQGELTGLRLTSNLDEKGNTDGALFQRVVEKSETPLEDFIIGEWKDTYCFDGMYVVNSKSMDKYIMESTEDFIPDDFYGDVVFCADGTGYTIKTSGATDSFVYQINGDKVSLVFENGGTREMNYSKDTGCLYISDSEDPFPRTYIMEKVS